MSRRPPIRTRPGARAGEFIVTLPPGWELRLRRIVRELEGRELPDPNEKGLSPRQREWRIQQRRQWMREAMCRFVSEVLTADIVGREVALTTPNTFGSRRGSLREQVQSILRQELPPSGNGRRNSGAR